MRVLGHGGPRRPGALGAHTAEGHEGGVVDRGVTTGGGALLVLLCTAQFIVALDVTVVNVALPSIGTALRFDEGQLTWVVSVYVLVTGTFLLVAGRLSDLLGARRMLFAGLILFVAASLASGMSSTPTALIASRGVQGLGAALLSPAALSIISVTYTGAARARALGLWGAIASGGAGAGLLVGGALTTWFDWSWVFAGSVSSGGGHGFMH